MNKNHLYYLALLIVFNQIVTSLYGQVDISATPTRGKAPLNVQFYYSSNLGGSIEYTKWEFGDGKKSWNRTPTHTYLNAGTYTIDFYIKVNYSSGSSTRHVQKRDYISVSEPNTAPTINVYPDTLIFKEQKYFINDTLIYDDGVPDKYYRWSNGTRMASRMSPARPCKIIAIQLYCWSSQIYKVGIYKLENDSPGEELFEGLPFYSFGQGWKTRDISGINVSEDFIASFNMIDTTAAIGYDSENNNRTWIFNGSTWDIFEGTWFIRSIVGYENGVIDTLEALTVNNRGTEDLVVNNIFSNQPWIIDVNPASFTLQYAESKRVDVSVSQVGLNNLTYLGSLNLISNDPVNSFYNLPVKFILPSWYTAIGVNNNVEVPNNIYLNQNYPNPFNPVTTIEYQLPKDTHVTLSIFNIKGELVKTLKDERQSAGYHKIQWNGRDENSNSVSGGLYLYHLKADGFSQSNKMVLIR